MSIDEERQSIARLIAQMERHIDAPEDRLDALRTVPGTLEGIDRRLWEGEKVMKELGGKMDANTVITTGIRDAQMAGRVVNGVGKWLGAAIIGGLGLWASVKGFRL